MNVVISLFFCLFPVGLNYWVVFLVFMPISLMERFRKIGSNRNEKNVQSHSVTELNIKPNLSTFCMVQLLCLFILSVGTQRIWLQNLFGFLIPLHVE